MSLAPFTLMDRLLGEGFRRLGQGKGRLRDFQVQVDQDAIPWAFTTTNCGCIGFCLAPNWLFDPFAVQQLAGAAAAERQRIQQLAVGQHHAALGEVFRRLRLGRRTERLALTIHRAVMRTRSSVLEIPDIELGAVAWGHDRSAWPRHWRGELLASLESLTWLHIAPGTDQRDFGMQTALLTHAGDLRGTTSDTCDHECPLQGDPRHHHFQVNVGRGFLGVLETCAEPDDGTGVRSYAFPIDARSKSAPTLRHIGKSGRLTSIYMPAVLGSDDACERLTRAQHRLLQALVRETTRKSKADRKETGEPEVTEGNNVPFMTSKVMTCCPFLEATGQYINFGGNGKRKRLGYKLNTEGGWLVKAGYAIGDIEHFLVDLEQLAQILGLIVVGLLPADRSWRSLSQIRDMLGPRSARTTLGRLHVRVYTPADYVARWNRAFGWSDTPAAPAEQHGGHDDVQQELQRRLRRRGFRRQLAVGLDVDPSLLGKMVAGKKPWPVGWLDRIGDWLAAHPAPRTTTLAPTCTASPIAAGDGHSFAVVARDYLRRGFSVVPQLAGKKHPCVRWKPFQERAPTMQEVEAWAQQWPNAGLALVLGLVSGVFVIDVDGTEAHHALLDHLGDEPVAPKVLSGSHQPNRYHLFFRCPAMNTKAKVTPWHRKLEFRGKGGVVILPPSVHQSGNSYAWADGRSLDDVPLPELPAAILTVLASRPLPPVNTAPLVAVNGIDASQSTLEFLTGKYANGPRWNDRIFAAACDLAGHQMPRDVAERLLLVGARPWDQSQHDAAIRTIHSAFQQRREPARV